MGRGGAWCEERRGRGPQASRTARAPRAAMRRRRQEGSGTREGPVPPSLDSARSTGDTRSEGPSPPAPVHARSSRPLGRPRDLTCLYVSPLSLSLSACPSPVALRWPLRAPRSRSGWPTTQGTRNAIWMFRRKTRSATRRGPWPCTWRSCPTSKAPGRPAFQVPRPRAGPPHRCAPVASALPVCLCLASPPAAVPRRGSSLKGASGALRERSGRPPGRRKGGCRVTPLGMHRLPPSPKHAARHGPTRRSGTWAASVLQILTLWLATQVHNGHNIRSVGPALMSHVTLLALASGSLIERKWCCHFPVWLCLGTVHRASHTSVMAFLGSVTGRPRLGPLPARLSLWSGVWPGPPRDAACGRARDPVLWTRVIHHGSPQPPCRLNSDSLNQYTHRDRRRLAVAGDEERLLTGVRVCFGVMECSGTRER